MTEQVLEQPSVNQGFNEDSTLKLGEQEYRYGDLSDQAKQLIRGLRASELQMNNLRTQLGVMDVGRRAIAAQLKVAIENPEALQNEEAEVEHHD